MSSNQSWIKLGFRALLKLSLSLVKIRLFPKIKLKLSLIDGYTCAYQNETKWINNINNSTLSGPCKYERVVDGGC